MAVDTKAKRFSMMTFGELPWEWALNPDNEIDADDRYSFMGLYGGLTEQEGGGDMLSAWKKVRRIRMGHL